MASNKIYNLLTALLKQSIFSNHFSCLQNARVMLPCITLKVIPAKLPQTYCPTTETLWIAYSNRTT